MSRISIIKLIWPHLAAVLVFKSRSSCGGLSPKENFLQRMSHRVDCGGLSPKQKYQLFAKMVNVMCRVSEWLAHTTDNFFFSSFIFLDALPNFLIIRTTFSNIRTSTTINNNNCFAMRPMNVFGGIATCVHEDMCVYLI